MVAVMRIYCRKKCFLQSANPGNERPSCNKAESGKFQEEKFSQIKGTFSEKEKGLILINSLTAVDGRDSQFFDKLLCRLVTSPIFVRF